MRSSIETLLERYRQLVTDAFSPDPEWVSHYNDLRLVDASLDKVALSQQHPNHPLQIGIVGPTQAGKSTLVNLLTDSNAAGVSARAGFTVHAQGFGINLPADDLTPIRTILEPMEAVSAADLQVDNLEAYVLEPAQAGRKALVDQAVVWDSPDFDSIEARGYRGAVLYTLALSDALILMVSKDKYGDKSVWDMLSLMVPLSKPILVVINKLNEQDKAAVERSFQERFHSRFPQHPAPHIVSLPYLADKSRFPKAQMSALQTGLDTLLANVQRDKLTPAIEQFVQAHWSQWVAPAEHERAAAQSWNDAVSAAVQEAFSNYESRYLNDDSRNDTFNRALAELLTLLEVPGLATGLQKTREVVTWPVRKIFGFGMDRLGSKANATEAQDLERDVLRSICTSVITQMQGVAIDAQDALPEQLSWWRALHTELKSQRDGLSADFDNASTLYREDFEPRIEAAAARLYQQLETQPALLNSLRAARVTTDATAVVLAVKSGGLAATDLLVAPAMLSLTTLLTESALGRYMTTVRNELKNEQRHEVRERVFDGVLGAALMQLPESMDRSTLLGLDTMPLTPPAQSHND